MSRFDDHALEVALAWHLVEGIVQADEATSDAERAYQDILFPREVLEREGFCDEEGVLTLELEEARRIALAELPGRLSLEDKLEIVTMCVDAAIADGADAREMAALRNAVEVLGISEQELDAHLDSLPTVGTVELELDEEDKATVEGAPPRD